MRESVIIFWFDVEGNVQERFYGALDEYTHEFYLDIEHLPKSIFFAALSDDVLRDIEHEGERLLMAPIDWLINDWGGQEIWVEVFKEIKGVMEKEIEGLIKKADSLEKKEEE